MPAVEIRAHSEDTDWITTTQGAYMLNLTERRTRQLLAAGRLCGRLVGGRWQVDRASVLDMLARRAA